MLLQWRLFASPPPARDGRRPATLLFPYIDTTIYNTSDPGAILCEMLIYRYTRAGVIIHVHDGAQERQAF